MKQWLLASPVLPAAAAHALAWVAALFLLNEFRENQGITAMYGLFFPVVLSAGTLVCAVLRIRGAIPKIIAWIAAVFVYLGSFTIGLYFVPSVVPMFVAAYRLR